MISLGSDAVLEKVPLPSDPELTCQIAFPISNDLIDSLSRLPGKRDQCVKMVGHQQDKFRNPAIGSMIVRDGLE
jgi:hypothetical protein